VRGFLATEQLQALVRLEMMLQRIEREADRMDVLLEVLLTLHHLESGPLRNHRTRS